MDVVQTLTLLSLSLSHSISPKILTELLSGSIYLSEMSMELSNGCVPGRYSPPKRSVRCLKSYGGFRQFTLQSLIWT